MCSAPARCSSPLLRDQSCIHKASGRVSGGNGICSTYCTEEIEQITKPILSKASAISGVCWVSAGARVFATAVLGSLLPLKPNLSWAWISTGAKLGSPTSFPWKTQELRTWSMLALCLCGISQCLYPLGSYMWVLMGGSRVWYVLLQNVKDLERETDMLKLKKKKKKGMFIGPITVSSTIFCRKNANKETRWIFCLWQIAIRIYCPSWVAKLCKSGAKSIIYLVFFLPQWICYIGKSITVAQARSVPPCMRRAPHERQWYWGGRSDPSWGPQKLVQIDDALK